mmetsp:Transcript_97389/g.167895  ORF Transcript_97389/g.167895 Transcript_97389/m.167895 type:complete len:94 (-) Transcript_97389:208-489(-)
MQQLAFRPSIPTARVLTQDNSDSNTWSRCTHCSPGPGPTIRCSVLVVMDDGSTILRHEQQSNHTTYSNPTPNPYLVIQTTTTTPPSNPPPLQV